MLRAGRTRSVNSHIWNISAPKVVAQCAWKKCRNGPAASVVAIPIRLTGDANSHTRRPTHARGRIHASASAHATNGARMLNVAFSLVGLNSSTHATNHADTRNTRTTPRATTSAAALPAHPDREYHQPRTGRRECRKDGGFERGIEHLEQLVERSQSLAVDLGAGYQVPAPHGELPERIIRTLGPPTVSQARRPEPRDTGPGTCARTRTATRAARASGNHLHQCGRREQPRRPPPPVPNRGRPDRAARGRSSSGWPARCTSCRPRVHERGEQEHGRGARSARR